MGDTFSKCLNSGNDPSGFLKGKVMMKLEHAKELKREGMVELSKLSGHANYISELANWAAVDRRKDDLVYVFSYRHIGGKFEPTSDLGDRYLSSNYSWALDYLNGKEKEGKIAIGWLDILCTCHDEETLIDAFGYMGDLYLNNKVVNNYMTTPSAFAGVQTRGWIYQESAFPSIDVQGWNDRAWEDITHYRVVADLILRRGYQGDVKTKALDLQACRDDLISIVNEGRIMKNEENQAWWGKVDNYIDMICDPEGLGIVLDLYGLYMLAQEGTEAGFVDLKISSELQTYTEKCYGKVVNTLKNSLNQQASPSMLGYFAVGAIKAFLSSELSVESDRDAAIFGVLRELSSHKNSGNEGENILHFIWSLAYPKGEIIAATVRANSYNLAGLGSIEAVEGESIAPHIPHLKNFVSDEDRNPEAKLWIGITKPFNSEMEFSVEIFSDEKMKVKAIRFIPKTYWNYNEVLSRVPKSGTKEVFKEEV